MRQGDIYLATLDPVIGSEQSKTRPCVIISTNLLNEYANTVTIAPLTTKLRKLPFKFHIKFKESNIKIEQLRTVDKQRLVKKVGNIDSKTLIEIKKAIILYFDI
jgi:mRNA interferase MazF